MDQSNILRSAMLLLLVMDSELRTKDLERVSCFPYLLLS